MDQLNSTLPHGSLPLVPVALLACSKYAAPSLQESVFAVLEASGWRPAPGSRVLVKPNLLRADALTCTHPSVVAAACQWLSDLGTCVTVADSPGFGSARGVAASIGLDAALKPLGLTVQDLDKAAPLSLPSGGHWGVSRLALEADAVLSLPKVKAHVQVRLTLSVKNLFGCVCGLRKAVAHTVQGESLEHFTDALVALWEALPPSAALADGIEAMHVRGPSGGQPYPLHCLAASSSTVALDTALYELLGLGPDAIPLWQALLRRQIREASPTQLSYPLEQPAAFAVKDFQVPHELMDISFQPRRLLVSLCRRIWSAWKN